VNSSEEDHTILFSQLIARTAKDIEVFVDSLPSEESNPVLQTASIEQLEIEANTTKEQLLESGSTIPNVD